MQKSILVLPDGTELSSGRGTTNALMNVQYTELVNSDTELTLGSVCSSCIEATLIAPGGKLSIAAGTEVTVYEEDDDGSRVQTGIFKLEKPTRASANAYKLMAYDRIVNFDTDLTSWLQDLKESFPMTLQTFVEAVCAKCGVVLANTYISNGDLRIEYFSPGEVTGRKLIKWAAEITGGFVRANTEGKIEFAWYDQNDTVTIGPYQGENENTKQISYFQGSLSYEDYEVMAIEKVQIKNSDDDIGTVWPSDLEEGNTYVVSSNMILMNSSKDDLEYVAQYIYQTLMNAVYVPCKVSVGRGSGIRAGDIVTVTDVNGATFNTYVMQRTVSGGKETLECTGSQNRGSTSAINNRDYKDLEGRILRIQTSVEGIKTEVKDAEKNITELQQNAGQVSVKASSEQGTLETIIKNDGTWKSVYTDANGNELSGITFDFLLQSFVFKGSGEFTGKLNIGNGNFVVDEFGNLVSKGAAEIIGGKFYALNEDGTIGDCFEITSDGLTMYRTEDDFPVFSICKNEADDGNVYPYILLNSEGSDDFLSNFPCKIQRFADGLWIGNLWVSMDDSCNLKTWDTDPMISNGIFISLVDKTTYVIDGNNRKSIYTGDTIARFG